MTKSLYSKMCREKKDIESIINHRELFLPLTDSSILVTGATGLIGSMLIKTFYEANKKYNLGIHIVGQIRDFVKARDIFQDIFNYLEFVKETDGEYDYIIHTLSPTSSKYFIEKPVETIKVSIYSTIEALEVAKVSKSKIVYLSSMEQYGIPHVDDNIMTEEKIGMINHLNIRSSYSESKRMCECLCASYASEYNVDVKIARLAQTFGTGASLTDNRMPMQFAKAVVEGKDIVLHTEGNSISNFVYLTDCIIGILTILVSGKKGEAYNVCNEKETRRIRDIADLVCQNVAGNKIKVVTEINNNMGYAPDVVMYLSSKKLRQLGWNAEVCMIEAYNRLVEYIQDKTK